MNALKALIPFQQMQTWKAVIVLNLHSEGKAENDRKIKSIKNRTGGNIISRVDSSLMLIITIEYQTHDYPSSRKKLEVILKRFSPKSAIVDLYAQDTGNRRYQFPSLFTYQ